MPRLVALLRGINLGGKRRVAMADLRALLEALGYGDVRTLLQSGNAVFTARRANVRRELEAALAKRFGMEIDVVLRTMDELRAVVDADPFGAEVTDPRRYFVVFVEGKADVSGLDGVELGPDRFVAGEREIYAWCPEGMQGSRLMRELGKPRLARTATVRNWSTVTKLLE
jgi:uncharacterized protein (DUF1697 family)